MNRYPLWKYITVLIAVIIGLLYTLPNFYGESPAVQVSSAKATIKVDPAMLSRVEQILTDAKIPNEGVFFETNGPRHRARPLHVDRPAIAGPRPDRQIPEHLSLIHI